MLITIVVVISICCYCLHIYYPNDIVFSLYEILN